MSSRAGQRAGYVEVAPTRWEHEGRWLDRPSIGEPDGRIPLTARGLQRGGEKQTAAVGRATSTGVGAGRCRFANGYP